MINCDSEVRVEHLCSSVVVNLQFRIKLGKLEHRSQRNTSWSKGEN